MSYLVNVRPTLVRVRFAFDIADVRDGWLDILQTLFRASQCAELEYAELNWNETPAKPYVPENSSATWCTNDYKVALASDPTFILRYFIFLVRILRFIYIIFLTNTKNFTIIDLHNVFNDLRILQFIYIIYLTTWRSCFYSIFSFCFLFLSQIC